MELNNKLFNAVLVMTVLFVVVLLLLIIQLNKVSEIRADSTKLINALNDTVSYYVNSQGESVARIKSLEFQSQKDFLNIQFKDSLITELQSRVKYYKGKADSVVDFDTEGSSSRSSETEVQVDTVTLYPIYVSHYTDDWIDLRTKATVDSTAFNLRYKDRYSVIQVSDNTGDYVEIINQSPYVDVTNVRSFKLKSVPYKPRRWGLGIQLGGGMVYYDSQFRLSPYIGIGVNYNILTW